MCRGVMMSENIFRKLFDFFRKLSAFLDNRFIKEFYLMFFMDIIEENEKHIIMRLTWEEFRKHITT